ncbi:MAG: exosortase/archaeosortase family protein [Candidatus Omnitrophica bacterium]|nr:exosortase/archaeosortase family protein [Candidatus Omnitrophota bacterium]
MAFSSNNKTPGNRRYTTRQIMELTEKRRKQMDEDARLRKLLAPLAEETVGEKQPASAELPKTEDLHNSVNEEPVDFSASQTNDQAVVEPPVYEAPIKTSISEPADSVVQESSGIPLVNDARPFTQELENVSVEKSEQTPFVNSQKEVFVNNVSATAVLQDPQLPFRQSREPKDDDAFKDRTLAPFLSSASVSRVHKIILQILEFLFTGLSCALISMMMIHILSTGWTKYYYDQSPFVLLVVLSMLWLNRSYLKKRKEWFWGSSVIVAGGLGVFLAAALEGHAYIELAGFVIVSFGLLLWRYQEESACRLFFPLLGFFFIFAPPVSWEQALINPLNDLVYHVSSWAVNSFHIPVDYDGHRFHVSGSTIFFQGDPTVFRSIFIGVLLAIACLSFQNLAMTSSVFLFASVAVWAFFANVVRVTTTGLIMENFGLEYAANFFAEYSFYMVLVVMLAGISLTAGLLPHKEDFD